MKIITSYFTDEGNTKRINQDSLMVKVVNSVQGKIVFAVICDGIGGLDYGELASKEVIFAFDEWFQTKFRQLVLANRVTEEGIYDGWNATIVLINRRLMEFGLQNQCMLGTTTTILLVYQDRYYICHIGDSRIYKIDKALRIMTTDHTLVEYEVRMGKLSSEQAKVDTRKNVLMQCIGASAVVEPQLLSGRITEDVTFLLCTDGLIHTITEDEIYNQLRPGLLEEKSDVKTVCETLGKLAMSRGERDNITAIGVVLKK